MNCLLSCQCSNKFFINYEQSQSQGYRTADDEICRDTMEGSDSRCCVTAYCELLF